MEVIWLSLLVVFIFSFLARYYAAPTFIDQVYIKSNGIFAFFSGVILILVSGLRNGIGDTPFYMLSYTLNDFTWESIQGQKDIGFNILQMFLQSISDDPQFMIFIVSLITNALIVFVFYNYSRVFEISLYVYITSGLFITSMNGLRQFLAAAIVFATTKFLFNGDWKKYFIIILIAAQIHNTAYILIPIYFIVRKKAWTGLTFSFLFFAVIIVLGFNQFTSVLFSALDGTQYADYKNTNNGGANIIRVFVFAMPVILAYIGREKLREDFPKADIVVNMSLLGVVFMIISTQDWIFARFTYYFGLYNAILISWVIKLFPTKQSRLVYYLILLFYLLYFYYENVISLGLIYESDFLPW